MTDQLNQGAREYYRAYCAKHTSPNDPTFEFLCIYRSFLMAQFLARYHQPALFHVDTDVILQKRPEAWGGHPGTAWVIDAGQDAPMNYQSLMIAAAYLPLDWLKAFLQTFYEAFVQDDEPLDKVHGGLWASKIENVHNDLGAVSDMTIWWMALALHAAHLPLPVDLAEPRRPYGEADIRMSFPGRFRMASSGDVKELIEGHFVEKGTGRLVAALTTHYSGPLKDLMLTLPAAPE